jgi:nucleoside 2-deoxyribosyltransferase
MRIDAADYAGGVMDQIIAEIRRSRLVIADCTQQRNGVYFEAGFAVGLGLTLIPTCRSDDMKNRHFDIQHLNTLEWKTPEELVGLLSKRIVAIVGPGPDLPPP